jgi:hypothetical protein
MQALAQKLKKRKRKIKHVNLLENRIAELNAEIIHNALNGITNTIPAELIKKYNRRLKLILY